MELDAIDEYGLKQVELVARAVLLVSEDTNPIEVEIRQRQFRQWADPATVLAMVIKIRELEKTLEGIAEREYFS